MQEKTDKVRKLVEEVYLNGEIRDLIKMLKSSISNNLKTQNIINMQNTSNNKLEEELYLKKNQMNSALKKLEEVKKKYQ